MTRAWVVIVRQAGVLGVVLIMVGLGVHAVLTYEAPQNWQWWAIYTTCAEIVWGLNKLND